MPIIAEFYNLLQRTGNNVYTVISELSLEAWVTKEPQPFSYRCNGLYRKLKTGDTWGRLFDCAWMRVYGEIPESEITNSFVVLIDIGGEGLIVNNSGEPVCGITNKASSYGVPPDKPGKWVVSLSPVINENIIEFWVDAACNDLFGYVQNGGVITDIHVAKCNVNLKSLYYDIETLLDWITPSSQNGNIHPKGICDRHHQTIKPVLFNEIMSTLHSVKETLVSFSLDEIFKCKKMTQRIIKKKKKMSSLQILAIGHAHLDIAWMWPIREGRRKAIRTFSTALANIEKYPDYIFGASQYQLFDWIKKDYPHFFERLKKNVQVGRFELQGGLWVECDLHLINGESLIRQIMFATKFTETNFSRKVTHAWLPDVFGFPASVPQILSKSGIKYLASQKLSQNKINKFDNYLYRWKGLDGSEIIMHNFPENSYDSSARATSLEDIENNYKEKDICPYALMVYGVGDGGAGPGEEHIERLNRICNISILPDVSFGHVEDFFAKVERYHKNLPLITGELYFEAHQGCFTTESRTKANNRKTESNLHDAEFFISTAQSIPASMFAELSKLWKETLTLQFHDIIAETCIARVYQETEKQYFHLNSRSQNIINFCRSELATRIDTKQVKNPHIIFNSTSFPRSEWINIQGVWLKVKVSPFGYNVIEPIAQEIIEPRRKNNTIENNYVRLTFSDSGDLQSLYDLRHGKEFISEKLSSELCAYHEDAGFFAAWDFAPDYRSGESSILRSEKMESIIDGPTISMVVHYRYHSSKLRLAFTLCQDSPRVDVRTYIDWHEPNVSLKIKFPVSIKTDTAQCHTQFGVIDRPTHSNDSFAFAKDEIPAHLWVDISDTISGLALISKDKYGFRVKDQSLELTLLRSQHKPGEAITKKNHEDYLKNNFSDIGEQEFTFSLLPHTGDYYEGKVFKHSYMLNHPLHILPVDSHRGILPPSLSFISQNSTHIIIETVKPAEDGNGIIVRLYECYGKKTSTLLKWEYPYDYIQFVDMQENALKPPVYCERAYPLDFTPFEIVTVRITE